MCEFCDSEETMMYCQDCGKWLCYDHKGEGDDVIGRPYVTGSGDLFCVWHGRQHDEAEEAYAEEEDWFDMYTEWEDIVEGETGGRFIGDGSGTPRANE